MNEIIPNAFRADINTVFKVIAVLKHVDEFKLPAFSHSPKTFSNFQTSHITN